MIEGAPKKTGKQHPLNPCKVPNSRQQSQCTKMTTTTKTQHIGYLEGRFPVLVLGYHGTFAEIWCTEQTTMPYVRKLAYLPK